MTVEQYLNPSVANQIRRLDLRAKFVVRGFLQGLHASPFQGFSVEFSEHRRYTPGDNPDDIDWSVYAKTDKYYIKKFEAETNITGLLVVDSSASMGFTYRQELTKFDYVICLAAALAYLMISQQDPVGLVTFKEKIQTSLAPHSKRSQLGSILSLLSRLKPEGKTDLAHSLIQVAAMLKTRTLVMIFSDLLEDDQRIMDAMYRLKHRGNDVILFHVLDESEVAFPFQGLLELEDPETLQRVQVDANSFRADYTQGVAEFRDRLQQACQKSSIDYVPLDTSLPFDKALLEYLVLRRSRG